MSGTACTTRSMNDVMLYTSGYVYGDNVLGTVQLSLSLISRACSTFTTHASARAVFEYNPVHLRGVESTVCSSIKECLGIFQESSLTVEGTNSRRLQIRLVSQHIKAICKLHYNVRYSLSFSQVKTMKSLWSLL